MIGTRHIVVAILLPYSRSGDFWGRDAGLLARGFRELGYQTTFVALPGAEEIGEPEGHEKEGFKLAGFEKLQSPIWWKHLSPDMVVLFGWTLPKYQAVRNAILDITPHLVERMDTDGMRSALLSPAWFFYLMWSQAMDRRGAQKAVSWKAIPSACAALARTIRSIFGAPVFGTISARTVAGIPAVLVESPVALMRIKKWQRLFGYSGRNIHFVPHAVDTENLPMPEWTKIRPKRVVAIGRWKSFQKNYELTWRVAREFLSARPEYEFHFVGENPEEIIPLNGIFHHGRLAREEVGQLLCSSRIHFSASRYESFHLGAAEALCCGCSVVMPRRLPTAEWFSSANSGTLATQAKLDILLAKLLSEAEMWDWGSRSPENISSRWRLYLSARRQAEAIGILFTSPGFIPPHTGFNS